jgi:hypothetical protein
MNQASFDYAVLNDSVAAELESLRAEKQTLAENIRTTELRLTEISQREEKLARLSESLTDLLTAYPINETAQATSPSIESETPNAEKDSFESPANESALLTGEEAVVDAGQTTLLDAANASPAESSVPEADLDGEIIVPPTITHREFNKAEFFKIYPHLEGAQQPIHILAQKLLEYIGRPAKLRDLTNYIVELGYRHNSQNFTNTVHTVLKNKRERNGGFYFDPKERMWELGHWRNNEQSATTNKTPETNSETAEQPANKQSLQQAVKRGDETDQSKFAGKTTQQKIKVIKAARQ